MWAVTLDPLPPVSTRSPAVASHEGAYGQRMAAWIRKSAFAKVLLLSSLPAEMRKDQQLSGGPQMTAGVCGSAGEAQTRAQTLGWRCVSFAAGIFSPLSPRPPLHTVCSRPNAQPKPAAVLHSPPSFERMRRLNCSRAKGGSACTSSKIRADSLTLRRRAND